MRAPRAPRRKSRPTGPAVLGALAAWMAAAPTSPAPTGELPENPHAVREITSDGAWSWFSDPRAVRVGERTFIGWVTSRGDIEIGCLSHATGSVTTSRLYTSLQVDDHAAPSILVLPDRRLMTFFSPHAGGPLYTRVTVEPEDIGSWGSLRALGFDWRLTYSNPIQLGGENGRIYLFWRDSQWRPAFAVSDDGVVWSDKRILIDTGRVFSYVKFATDGERRIHFAFTDTHPRFSAFNNVYHAYYEAGAFYRADGSLIRSLGDLPLVPSDADRVHDARLHGARAWIWDIALDRNGRPVIVYTAFPDSTDHRYRYARWDGASWTSHEITAAGGSVEESGSDPYYSGGASLDPENTAVVYLVRNVSGVHELERWVTPDGGETWFAQSVAAPSGEKNLRPVVPRNRSVRDAAVVWLRGSYFSYTRYSTAVVSVGADDPRIVSFHVKPGSCTAALQPASHGLTPGVVLGSAETDVREIDVPSVRMNGAPAVRSRIGDEFMEQEVAGCRVASPVGDGFEDLVLLFRTQELRFPQSPGRPVRLSGALRDGTAFFGSDDLRILEPPPLAQGKMVLRLQREAGTIRATGIVPAADDVSLDIFDARGRLVESLRQPLPSAGPHTFEWTARATASGVYFCRLRAAGRTLTRKIVVAD